MAIFQSVCILTAVGRPQRRRGGGGGGGGVVKRLTVVKSAAASFDSPLTRESLFKSVLGSGVAEILYKSLVLIQLWNQPTETGSLPLLLLLLLLLLLPSFLLLFKNREQPTIDYAVFHPRLEDIQLRTLTIRVDGDPASSALTAAALWRGAGIIASISDCSSRIFFFQC